MDKVRELYNAVVAARGGEGNFTKLDAFREGYTSAIVDVAIDELTEESLDSPEYVPDDTPAREGAVSTQEEHSRGPKDED